MSTKLKQEVVSVLDDAIQNALANAAKAFENKKEQIADMMIASMKENESDQTRSTIGGFKFHLIMADGEVKIETQFSGSISTKVAIESAISNSSNQPNIKNDGKEIDD